ncbi:MAG: hypothetical protein AAFO96_11420 [Bacteroidota bacterium]
MVTPEIKRGTDLTSKELEELDVLVHYLHHQLPENHIQINHVEKTNPLFYLYKVDEKIVACQAYTLSKVVTPFASRPLPIIYINISYKYDWANAHVKNFAKQSNLSFIRENIGRFWYFKKFILAFHTVNPKLVERLSGTFETYYPHYAYEVPSEVVAFANQFCQNHLQEKGNTVSPQLVSCKEEVVNPVTEEKWKKMYQSANPKRDKFFRDLGIYKEQPHQKILTGRQIFFVGVYSLGGSLRKMWQSWTKVSKE